MTTSVIVDCYTHVWDSEAQLGAYDPRSARPRLPNASDPLAAGIARHLAATEPVSAAIVVGFKSRYLGLEIPNSFIASYVNDHRISSSASRASTRATHARRSPSSAPPAASWACPAWP